jgi:protein-S-isoprenylcysteine O-methyltransferase Ste14
MNPDQMFRWILLALVAVQFPLMVRFRWRSRTAESLDRRQEGWFVLFTLRPVGLATLVGVVAYLVNPSSMAWAAAPFPVWLRWAAAGAAVSSGMLILWTMGTLGRNLTDTVVTRQEHTLVTNGPYRFVRHPFYDSVALWLGACGVVAANWFILAGSTVVIALLVLRTTREEERLVARFGEAYRRYMSQTGRFLPRVGAARS